jgi:SAM-dependent methyltransferase
MNIVKKTHLCRICGNSEVVDWLYPLEMMFGMREQFAYFRCATCGCLQLDEIPDDLAKYYPNDYYSYQTLQNIPIPWKTRLKLKLAYPFMTRHKLGWGSIRGRFLRRFKDGPSFPNWLRFLDRPVSLDGGVLDVGCGSGLNLLALRDCGFTNLRGVDPFISESMSYAGDVRVDKCQLQEVRGKFSLITFHHVFEHLANPLETLGQARELLATGGQIMIRIPLSDSVAAQKYREKWVQLDSPRHIILHTRKSMELVAKKSEMKIVRVTYDSTELQFAGSEQYLLDIPLADPRSYYSLQKKGIFSKEKIKAFTEEAERLNKLEAGDQAAFVLAC